MIIAASSTVAASLSGPGKWIGGPTDQTRHSVNVE
jgi:hypothetical protein